MLRDKDDYHVVVVRSTVLPGTTHGTVIPALEAASGKKYGHGFGVSVNPEFLREGTAIRDFTHPPLTLVGHNHAADAAPTKALYQNIDAPLFSASIRVAEMIKYTSNTWHAVKVVFANEIGNLCKRLGRRQPRSDGHLLPGRQAEPVAVLPEARVRLWRLVPAEGRARPAVPREGAGSRDAARRLGSGQQSSAGRSTPSIASSRPAARRSGCLGFSFKADTDDLRESPMVILAEALLGKGYELCIYDRNVSLARLVGANKQYINEQIPAPVAAPVRVDRSGHRSVGGHRHRQRVAGVLRGRSRGAGRIRSSSISCGSRWTSAG